MTNPTPPEEPTAQDQERAKKLRLARAFHEVFGQAKSRTAVQQLVYAHLEHGVDEGQNAYRFDGKDGISVIAAGIHRDGAQSLLRIINRQLKHAEEVRSEAPKPQAKVKR